MWFNKQWNSKIKDKKLKKTNTGGILDKVQTIPMMEFHGDYFCENLYKIVVMRRI